MAAICGGRAMLVVVLCTTLSGLASSATTTSPETTTSMTTSTTSPTRAAAADQNATDQNATAAMSQTTAAAADDDDQNATAAMSQTTEAADDQSETTAASTGDVQQQIDNINEKLKYAITGCKICFKETEGSTQCQGARDTCSGWSTVADNDTDWTEPFRDDTDGRGGGCKYKWRLKCNATMDENATMNTAATTTAEQIDAINEKLTYAIRSCQICFKEAEGSSQCQGARDTCSGWSTVADSDTEWTEPFRDDTDGRGGGCEYKWRLACANTTMTNASMTTTPAPNAARDEQQEIDDINEKLTQVIRRCKVCFQETEGSSQCQGSRQTCSGWSSVDNGMDWTEPFRDDTDGRPGGCKYQWRLICEGN